MKKLIAHTIIVLFLIGLFSPYTDSVVEFEEQQEVYYNSSAVRIDISSPALSMTADEVITFTATLYDSVNSIVAGEVSCHRQMVLLLMMAHFILGVRE